MATKLSRFVCAREGCSRRLPILAAEHGDPYCSNDCCRLDHGLPAMTDRRYREKTTCKACDWPLEEENPDCDACRNRAYMRRKKEARAA